MQREPVRDLAIPNYGLCPKGNTNPVGAVFNRA